MKELIYYTAFDPVDLEQLKTFIRVERRRIKSKLFLGSLIEFQFHGIGTCQYWEFNNHWYRDQGFAYLLSQFTDRTNVLAQRLIGQTNKKYPTLECTIESNSIRILRGEKTVCHYDFLDDATEWLNYHVIIMDAMNHPNVLCHFENESARPFPWNPHPQNITI